MEGKIIVYSGETGIGKIITPEKKKYNFSIDAWDDYDHLPKVGQVVQFQPDGFNATAITLLLNTPHADQPTSSPVENKSSADTQPPAAQSASPHNAASIPQPPAQSLAQASITLDYDIQHCIEQHFRPILQSIESNREILDEDRELDFLRMRRFLATAYNNLIEIDQSFENFELTQLRRQLLDLYDTYKHFESKTSHLANAYKQIFLNKQLRYKELHAKLELNKSEISKLQELLRIREAEIKEKQKILKTLQSGSEKYLYGLNEIKILKKGMVDAIHEIAILTDENRRFVEELDTFYKLYYEQFKKSFNQFIAENRHLLIKILNVLAFKFDKMMWERASRSEAIQAFFNQAGIYEDFSAVTYLKYYINTLDASKLSGYNQELYDLLHYLEEQKNHRLACLDEDPDFLSLIRQAVGKIDHTINIHLYTHPEKLLSDITRHRPTLIIINPQMRHLDPDHFIQQLKSHLTSFKLAFFSSRINRTLLEHAKTHNVTLIIPKTTDKRALHEHFKQFFKP